MYTFVQWGEREEGRPRFRCLCTRARVKLPRRPGISSQPGGIDSLESIPGLHKRLQIRAQLFWAFPIGILISRNNEFRNFDHWEKTTIINNKIRKNAHVPIE
jgi:hypothetical protein